MRKRILNLLNCPNTNTNSLIAYAHKLRRGTSIIEDVVESEMQENDDIVSGVLINKEKKYAFPIHNSIAILLSDTDTDLELHTGCLQSLREFCPMSFKESIDNTFIRFKSRKNTFNGLWNREEMAYFDRKVQSGELRAIFLESIRSDPLWNLFVSRKPITKEIQFKDNNRYVLEVGCSNARTVRWIFHPKRYHYHYIGSDISFKRLLLAKSVIPEGDFVQCSAFNLPFKDSVFAAVLGFGVFHHLPNPLKGIQNCASKIMSNGYFALHEPFRRPKLMPDVIAKCVFKNHDKDKHDNEIDAEKTLITLRNLGFKIILEKYENSIFRTLALSFLEKLPGSNFKRRRLIEVINFVDKILLKTICRTSKRLGPSGLLVLAQRPFH